MRLRTTLLAFALTLTATPFAAAEGTPPSASTPPTAPPTAAPTLTPLQAKAREIFEKVVSFRSIAPGYETPQLAEYLAGEFRAAGFAEEDILLERYE